MTTVYFDYACVYSYRLQRLIDMAELQVDWRPFLLDKANPKHINESVWDLAERDLPLSLLALAGHEFVCDQGGPGINSYRQETFQLFHESETDPKSSQIWHLVEKYTGYAKADLDLDGALERVKTSDELAASKCVFGTPTVFIAESDKPYFIKLEAVPATAQAAKALWKSLPKSAHHFPRPVIIKSAD